MQQAADRITSSKFVHSSDLELVEFAVNGESAAFEAIMRRYNQLLFRTARGIVRSDAEAEDVAQEALLNAWRSLSGFRAESKFSTWLVRIAVNVALGRLRRKRAQIIPLEVAMTSIDRNTVSALTDEQIRGPEHSAQRSQIRDLIETHIDRLPDTFRSVFMLRAVEEMSVEDIADVLELPQATVRTRYFRARNRLRESMSREVDISLGDVFSFAGHRCDRIVSNVMARARADGLCTEIAPGPAS